MWTASKSSVRRAKCGSTLLLLVLGWVPPSHGDETCSSPAGLALTERKLQVCRERVAVTAEVVSTAGSLRTAREWVLRACQASYTAVEKLRQDAEKAEALARIDAAAAEQQSRSAAAALESRRSEVARARDQICNQPVVAYQIVQHGNLTCNVLTGAVDLRLDEGPGIQLRESDLETLLSSKFQAPDVDPIEMATRALANRGRLEHNYNDVKASLRAKNGVSNVYLLSTRFLEWGSNTRLSGLSLNDEAAEARRQMQLEFEDFASWLRLKGINDLGPDPSDFLVELIRTGSYAPLGLSVKTIEVDCTHRFEPGGATEVPLDILKRLQPNATIGPRTPWQTAEKRPAIAIIWNGNPEAQQSLAAHLERDFRLQAPSIDDLPRRLQTPIDPRIRHLINWAAGFRFAAVETSAAPRRLARTSIGLRKEDIESSGGANLAIVDLRRTDFAEIIAPIVNQLALGNNKSSELDVIELDQSSGRLEVGFTLHHRHVWPSIREAESQLRTALGPAGAKIADLADRRSDATYDSARKLYGEADSKSRDASAERLEADRKVREASNRVANKRRELSALASDLSRARTDLRIASELEDQARREAQAACVEMTGLDTQVRIARNKLHAPTYPVPPRSLANDDRPTSKK